MNYPLKLNLKINNNENTNITGGNPKKILSSIDNINNNFVISIHNDENHKITFKFDDNLNTKIYKNSKFLGNGGITAVYGLRCSNECTDKKFLHLQDKELILRIQNGHNFCFDEFIENWKKHKKLFGENIIDIFFYGNMLNTDDEYIGKYIITRKYYNYDDIYSLSFDNTLKYFNSMCDFIKKLNSSNYFYRDLKFANIGMDINKINNKIIFIVLDYDDITLLEKNDLFLMKKENKYCDKYCSGTFMPYYMMHNYTNKNNKWKNELDKMHVYGLLDVIISLFYDDDDNHYNIIKQIYLENNDSADETKYEKFMLNFNSSLLKIKTTINNLTPKFNKMSFNTDVIIKMILLNLLSKKYEQIYSIDNIKSIINDTIVEQNNNKMQRSNPISKYTTNKVVDEQNNNMQNNNIQMSKSQIDKNVDEQNNTTTTKSDDTVNVYKNKYLKYKHKYLSLKQK